MSSTVVFIASDHAGFSTKANTIQRLKDMGYEVQDLGPSSDQRTDYPDWADQVALKLSETRNALGVLICGSGQGMAMRANKYPHIRAALCWNKESAELARQHNHANVLCFGARMLSEPMINEIVTAFFNSEFEGGRHQARVDKISKVPGT